MLLHGAKRRAWMTFTQLFHQSESEARSPLHVASRHETFHMLLSYCVHQMRNVCMHLLKSCYTHVVIKTFETRRFPSLLTDSFLSVLFVQSRKSDRRIGKQR